MKHYFNMNTRA